MAGDPAPSDYGRLSSHQNRTFIQCLLEWVHAANEQKGEKKKNEENPPSFNATPFHIPSFRGTKELVREVCLARTESQASMPVTHPRPRQIFRSHHFLPVLLLRKLSEVSPTPVPSFPATLTLTSEAPHPSAVTTSCRRTEPPGQPHTWQGS